MRNKQNDPCGTLSTAPVGRGAGCLVAIHFRPAEQCLPKTYVEFSMMNDSHQPACEVAGRHLPCPPHRTAGASEKCARVKALETVKVTDVALYGIFPSA